MGAASRLMRFWPWWVDRLALAIGALAGKDPPA